MKKSETTTIVPIISAPPAPVYPKAKRILWRGVVAMVPYLIALAAIKALVQVIAFLGLIAGAVEIAAPVVRREVCKLIRAARALTLKAWAVIRIYIMCLSIILGDWWRQSLVFREEILAQDRAPE